MHHSAAIERKTAVVLAEGINGLGVVRSLWQKGIGAIVVGNSRIDETFLSRLPIRKLLIATDADLQDTVEQLLSQMSDYADCVLAGSDRYASILQRIGDAGKLKLPCTLPPRNLIDMLNDKRFEIELIRHLDVPIPKSLLHLNIESSKAFSLNFPIIVKPRDYRGVEVLKAKNRVISKKSELERFLYEFETKLDCFIAQEIIPGGENYQWVCNAVFDQDAEMVSAFTFQRLGTVPYMYGVTTFAVSRHHPKIKDFCRQIGRTLNYTGSAMLEFKIDPRSGECCYIEINPRIGMCNWFDTQCGVNNVYNAYALAVGLPLEVNLDHQTDGRTYLNFSLDLYARRQAGLKLNSILRHYIENFPRRLVHPTFDWRDPVPTIGQYLKAISKRFWRYPPNRSDA